MAPAWLRSAKPVPDSVFSSSKTANCTALVNPARCAWGSGLAWLRVPFANFAADAANIGFDDSFIHQQRTRPVSERAIPMVQMMRKQALAAFHAWQQRGDRIPY